jgi:hypothetical protein
VRPLLADGRAEREGGRLATDSDHSRPSFRRRHEPAAETITRGGAELGDGTAVPHDRRSQTTVNRWNMVDSCGAQYALYFPFTSLIVTVFVPTNLTDVKVHSFSCGPSSS